MPIISPLSEEDLIEKVRAELAQKNPNTLALRAGAIFNPKSDSGGELRMFYQSREILLQFPAFTGKFTDDGTSLSAFDTALLTHYFANTDGTALAGQWIPFEQWANSQSKAQNFQQSTGDVLANTFGNNAEAFIAANQQINGRQEFFANLAYSYQVLPRVSLLVVCWLGSEDSPAAYRILFDANTRHHLSIEFCALLGSHLTQQIVNASSAPTSP